MYFDNALGTRQNVSSPITTSSNLWLLVTSSGSDCCKISPGFEMSLSCEISSICASSGCENSIASELGKGLCCSLSDCNLSS